MSLLFWGVLISSVGLGFFLYGKKQRVVVPLVCGVALMLAPYFISSNWILVGFSMALTAVPFFVKS